MKGSKEIIICFLWVIMLYLRTKNVDIEKAVILIKVSGRYFRETLKNMKLWMLASKTQWKYKKFPQNYFENIDIKLNKFFSVQNSSSHSGLAH